MNSDETCAMRKIIRTIRIIEKSSENYEIALLSLHRKSGIGIKFLNHSFFIQKALKNNLQNRIISHYRIY